MDQKTLVFATNNQHKVREVQALLGNAYRFLSLADIECQEELPETSDTLEGNALQKARYVRDHYGYDCFAEDTGLEVEALGNEPGVYTARYAGPERSDQANMAKVLSGLQGQDNRRAQFRTVVALILDGREHLFTGIAPGMIASAPRGEGGFGYDPVFIPEGYDTTFAEMAREAKNAISHRGKAIQQLQAFLLQQ